MVPRVPSVPWRDGLDRLARMKLSAAFNALLFLPFADCERNVASEGTAHHIIIGMIVAGRC